MAPEERFAEMFVVYMKFNGNEKAFKRWYTKERLEGEAKNEGWDIEKISEDYRMLKEQWDVMEQCIKEIKQRQDKLLEEKSKTKA